MAKHKIYVASSWRNEFYPKVVKALREAGHDVYDFRNPPSGDEGFKWATGTGSADPERMTKKEKLLHQLGYASIR